MVFRPLMLQQEIIMTKDDFIKIYCAHYKILEDNVIELSKYVTIDPANYATFSLQLHCTIKKYLCQVSYKTKNLIMINRYFHK